MTLATMADRSLPLAERVERLVNVGSTLSGAEYAAALDALLADVAAADRLARATAAWYVAVDEDPLPGHGMSKATAAEYEMDQAEEAYRARMAQGWTVGNRKYPTCNWYPPDTFYHDLEVLRGAMKEVGRQFAIAVKRDAELLHLAIDKAFKGVARG